MRFGLGVNANETTSEIVEKCVEAERFGLDCVWVSDVPLQRYALAVASAVAAGTKRLRIGLGLLSPFLHTPEQIADGLSTLVESYGDRFELCIGPGDRDQLERVGILLPHGQSMINSILDAKKTISRRLRQNKVRSRIWLGAQGPKMLKVAGQFDGVLLNYASPAMIRWAMSKINTVNRETFQFAVYAPAYVYKHFDNGVYTLLRIASAVVALGAPNIVMKRLQLYEKIKATKAKLKIGSIVESVLDEIPPEIVKLFSIYKSFDELRDYTLELSSMGIAHIVFGYPQNFSKKTVRDLAEACSEFRRPRHA